MTTQHIMCKFDFNEPVTNKRTTHSLSNCENLLSDSYALRSIAQKSETRNTDSTSSKARKQLDNSHITHTCQHTDKVTTYRQHVILSK